MTDYRNQKQRYKLIVRKMEEIINLLAIMGYDYAQDNNNDISELFFVLHETVSSLFETVKYLPIAMSGLMDASEFFNKTLDELDELNKELNKGE